MTEVQHDLKQQEAEEEEERQQVRGHVDARAVRGSMQLGVATASAHDVFGVRCQCQHLGRLRRTMQRVQRWSSCC